MTAAHLLQSIAMLAAFAVLVLMAACAASKLESNDDDR